MQVILPSFAPDGTPIRPSPPTSYSQTTTFGVGNLILSKKTIRVGDMLEASALITNTGPTEGMAQVYIQVNGKSLNSQKVALAIGESKTIKFMVNIPKTGTYSVSMGGLSENVEVI
jgi:hypothetical protein